MKKISHQIILFLLLYFSSYSLLATGNKYGLDNPFANMDSIVRDSLIHKISLQHFKKSLNSYYVRQLAEAYTAKNEADSAIAYWELFSQMAPNNDTAFFLVAELFDAADKPDSATGFISQALILVPDRIAYLSLSALLDYRLHRADEALSICDKILSLSPSEVNALLLSGIILRGQHKDSLALERFDTCLKAGPGNTDALLQRADEYVLLKRYNDALRDYSAARADLSDNADILNNVGICHYQAGAYREAITFFKRAILADHLHPQSYFNRGLSYYHLQMLDSTSADMKTASGIWDSCHTDTCRKCFLDATYYLGACYEKIGDLSSARKCFSLLQKNNYQKDLSPEISRIDRALFISRNWYWFAAIIILFIGLLIVFIKLMMPERQ